MGVSSSPTSSGPDDTKPKKSDPKSKESDPVSFIYVHTCKYNMHMYTLCTTHTYVHTYVYPVQDAKSSHPELETEEAKEKVRYIEVYVCNMYVGVGEVG